MQIDATSEAGSADKPNEDRIAVGSDMAAILDGATVRTDTGCIHGVAWFVEHLAAALITNSDLTPADALTAAITATAKAHGDTCDLQHPGTPSAAVAIVQARQEVLQYLVLGDVTLVADTDDALIVITDNRVGETARKERATADALPSGSPDKAAALVRMKHAELAARNVPGGFWVAAADPAAVAYAVTGEIPLTKLRQAALLTDGAARAVSPLMLYDWPGLLALLASHGTKELIRQIRSAEDTDPNATRWPRNKIHDDATAALVGF